ncbi:MAG: hypothetical protein M3O70_10860 [Actinomycetota bacterium]|nr:hypothetical protein [Actinomycetota bacterium]
MWNQWDAAHYVEIARVGYGPSWWNTAFFPLLPLAIRLFVSTGLDPTVAGMVIAAVASLVALVYLHRLAEEEIREGAGWRACTYLAFFPTAVFLVAPYGEPLFLAGTISAFYYARRARWRAVGLPAAVAVGSRLTGVAVLFGLLLEGLRQTLPLRKRLEQLGALAVGAIPLILYAAFLWRRMGHPLHFVIALSAWQRRATDPITTFQVTWQDMLHSNGSAAWAYAWRGEILAVLTGAFVLVIFLRRREWGYAGFMGATLAAYAGSGYYFATPRMLLTFFPIALLLAETIREERWHNVVLLMMASVAAVGAVVFTTGLWFF